MRDGVMIRAWTLIPALLLCGCIFSERSFPCDPRTRVVIDSPTSATQPLTPRAVAFPRRPGVGPPAAGAPQDFAIDRAVDGARRPPPRTLSCTSTSRPTSWSPFSSTSSAWPARRKRSCPVAPDQRGPPWRDFEDVWVPVRADLQLSGRLAWARDAAGNVIDADCIVIMPGIRGDNNILRVRDLAPGPARQAAFTCCRLRSAARA